MTHASPVPSPCECGQKICTCNNRANSLARARAVGKKYTCACVHFFPHDSFRVIGRCEANITHPVSPESRMNDLTPTQMLFLSRLAQKGDKAARAQVAAGEYTVEPFTVVVGGTLTVAEDASYTPTTSIPLLATMVVALHRAGVQREGIAAAIIDAAVAASANGGKVEAELADTFAYVESQVERLKRVLSDKLPKKTRAGAVKVDGSGTTLL